MEILILGALLLCGGLFSFGGGGSSDDSGGSPDTGNDQNGTSGNDLLTADSGTIHGLAGDDHITGSGTAETHGDAGNDSIAAFNSATAYGGDGLDVIDGSNHSATYGGAGDDYLNGYDHANLHGDAGDDRLNVSDTAIGHGDDGQDEIYIYDKAIAYGDAGNDILEVRDAGTAYGGDGTDAMTIEPSATGSLYGDAGDDTLVVWYEGHDAQLFGGDGNDKIYDTNWHHGDGASTLDGGAGDDTITAQTGTIDAGAGNDSIFLNAGQNEEQFSVSRPDAHVTGGEGHDSFTLTAAGARDDETYVITDFDPSQDQLSLQISSADLAQATITKQAFANHSEITVTLPDLVQDGGPDVAQVLHIRLDGITDPSLVTLNTMVS